MEFAKGTSVATEGVEIVVLPLVLEEILLFTLVGAKSCTTPLRLTVTIFRTTMCAGVGISTLTQAIHTSFVIWDIISMTTLLIAGERYHI